MVSAKDIKVGEYFQQKSDIMKVVRREVIAVGTHSHTRVRLIVKSISGGGEKQVVCSHEDRLDSVEVIRGKAQIVAKTSPTIQIMDLTTYETLESGVEPEMLDELKEGDWVTYVIIAGKIMVSEKLR